MAIRVLTALTAIVAAACTGATSPTAPTTAVGVSGPGPATWTLAGQVTPMHGPAVPGVRLEYASVTAQTDAAGRFSLTHQNASGATAMTLTHPTLLERQLWVRGGQSRSDLNIDPIALAPPFDLTFYRQLVRNALDAPGALQIVRRLRNAPMFYIQTVDDFGAPVDAATVQSTIDGIIAGVTQLTPFGSPVIETGAAPRDPAQGWVRVLYKRWTTAFDEGGVCGQAFVGADPGEIRLWLDRCRCSGDPGRVSTHLVLHEVGHAVGFWHVDGRHVMQPFVGCGPAERVASSTEQFHAAIAYRRPFGNADPDHDPSSVLASTSVLAAPPVLVSCGGGMR
jgi:hypothetical protein